MKKITVDVKEVTQRWDSQSVDLNILYTIREHLENGNYNTVQNMINDWIDDLETELGKKENK
ncbi:hypothetical protein [Spiroplasma endosymbiont of Amphimallon solstitiale]|uniref:hypothetical protein n=1 Tax=Spiroplasma endosymbiont of Amphimallon solstitiale TaxID=3066288 RepID=UPI00313C8397